MGNDTPRSDQGEEPPLVSGLLMAGGTRATAALRAALRSINRRVLLFIWGAGTVVTFFGILVLSIAQNPGIAGIAQGLFVGLFTALLFALGMGMLVLWVHGRGPRRDSQPAATAAISELETLLAPTLRELNSIRADVVRQVKARSVTRVPLGIGGGMAVWVLTQFGDDPLGLLGLLGCLVLGALLGEWWAVHKLEREYRRRYKDRILPQLAARIGDLTYRAATPAHAEKLRGYGVLPDYDSVEADDEIVGSHRGLSIEITEVRAKARVNKKTRVVFDGLVIELALPRALTGTTIVVTDEGRWGNLKARWRSDAMEPVRLEDPRFEERYEVYGSDQIEARALLTPAFMERFMGLASASGLFALPGALAERNHLVIALPKNIGTGDLFEPPAYWKPAGGRNLLTLEQDIRAVLRIADTVIELDFWSAGRKRDSMSTDA